MLGPARELRSGVWRHILKSNALGPAAAVVGFWGLYIAKVVYDVDIIEFFRHRQLDDPRDLNVVQTYFWMAIIASFVGPLVALFYCGRAIRLARNGVEVEACVTSIGPIKVGTLVHVDYEYTLDGKPYRKAMSCLDTLANEYLHGTKPLVVICDPRNPERSLLKRDVLPEEGDS